METIKFSSTTELYNRLKPALECKKNDLKRKGFPYLKQEDIWNALKKYKWNTAHDLSLDVIVDDILNTEVEFFANYLQNEFKNLSQEINLDEKDLL